jgi:hypothetical protein
MMESLVIMNLKKLSLGLALAGLGVVTLIPKAEAFQFRYLNQAPNPEGGFDLKKAAHTPQLAAIGISSPPTARSAI